MAKSRKDTKVIHGIVVNGLKINIYEMKRQYEVHVIFDCKGGDLAFEEKLDGTMNYLQEEGYFDNKKRVKVIGMTMKDNE